MKEPKVAVLILNYNGRQHLKECLESLKEQFYSNYEVFIVDNNSMDGSVEYVKEKFPWVKFIIFDRNLGFAKAYNEAIQRVDAELVALLNNDTRVDGNWLKELVYEIYRDESIIATGSKILLYSNPQLLNHAGAKLTLIGGGFDIGVYEKDCAEYNVKKFVGAVCGASMLVRKKLFIKIGGFDEKFFAYFEDTDFCWRAWIYGYKILYVPSSIVYHKLGASWNRKSLIRIYLGEKNRLTSMLKNFEFKHLILGLFLYLSFYIPVIIFLNIYKKSIASVVQIIKANLYIMKNISKIIERRAIIQRKRVISDEFLFRQGFIASLNESVREFIKINLIRSKIHRNE